MTLRRFYLPREDDSPMSIARAIWLSEYLQDSAVNGTAAGIDYAFNGKRAE